MKKLALFDFCETLVSFQTADAFVDFIRKKQGSRYMIFLNNLLILLSKLKILSVFNKLIPKLGLAKRVKLLQLRGLSVDIIEVMAKLFYQEMIVPAIIYPVLNDLQNLSKHNYQIGIVSAGYSIYIKYFVNEFNIDHNISTEIAFSKDGKKCLGKIRGKDCISFEKVDRINYTFNGLEVDFKESISYSDSITDLPMLQMTGKGVVVSQSKSQAWVRQYKLLEIIWNKKWE